mgnify:CR=1 FL=1|jgi:lysophospholipase L1-like esterase
MSNTVNNYTETDLGNISLNPRGEYDNSAAYEYLDTVSYRGGSYFCLAELETTITGIAPDAGRDSEHWQMIAAPGDMTPEYTAAYNDVIKKAAQVETSRAAVELAQQEIEAVQTDVQQLHSDTVQATQEAENSKNSAANSAQSAEQSRKTVSESEQNINGQIAGFDSRVSEAVEQSKEEINTTKQQAINTITNQQDASVNIVKTEGEKIITRVGNDAKTVADDRATVEEATQTVLNNAQEVAQNTQTVASNTENAAASAESAKTSADNAAKSAKGVEDASKQIEQNKKDVASLKEDINDAIIVKKNETFSGKDIDWINGFYGEDGTITPHTLYKHTRVFKVEPETKVTYAYLRSPANYSPYIACFKNGVYIKKSSLLGDVDANFKSGEFTIPQDIDGISFASYNAPNDERLSISGIFLYYKPDVNAEKIENIENNIQHMESDIAGNYNQIYNVKKYTITDGIGIKGNYYDKNGKLQPADNLSTTGIFPIPYGIKSITYTAFRSVDIPTILFLSADMKVAGMVIATTAPTYGDTMYSGIAEIPSNAVYMEFSVLNTNNDSSVTVMYSNIESNQKRIEILEKDPLYGKKITCTGNSITAATHSVPGHGYVEQIADAHGMTVDNHAIWGAIIPQGHPRTNDDVTDIGCIHDTLDDMDADADIVIMSGSINDCEYYADTNFLGEITGDFSTELDLTTFYGALEDMCKKALQKWAGKPIIYVIEHRMTLDNTTYGQYYLKLHEAIVKVMNKWGISIADLFNDCPSLKCNEGYKTKYTTGDGTHPNYEGYERFYVPRVYAEIKKLLGI